MHLTPEQLVDLAEGTPLESPAPRPSTGDRDVASDAKAHLATCDSCRRQLADLRATMSAAAGVEVPEPSPLFWDHLSARVSEAVAVEPARDGWNWWLRAAMPFALATAVAVAIAFAIVTRLLAPAYQPAPTPMAFVATPPPPAPSVETLAPDVTDPSLALVADLAQELGWEEAHEAGLAPRGSADHAVTHLTEGELQRLRDLLQEEMGKSSD